MIEVVFLGVGEAFDERLPNTSILIRYSTEPPVTLLLDCGFTVPPQFWREEANADVLDGIWISHFHGDHCLGIPALLVRFWEEGRKKALTILGQKGIALFIRSALDIAYPGMYERLQFPLNFEEVEPKKEVMISGLIFQSAVTSHAQRNLALRISLQGKSIYYSGDGKSTPECVSLAKGCGLIIHEAFSLDTEIPGHGTVMGSIAIAKECGASALALVHIQRTVRKKAIEEMQRFTQMAGSLNLIIPEPGFTLIL